KFAHHGRRREGVRDSEGVCEERRRGGQLCHRRPGLQDGGAVSEAGWVKVKCFTVDIGQPDELDISDVVKKMAPCGLETTVVDLKDDIAECAFECIACMAMYDGGYWQSTGVGRIVTARGLLLAMKKQGCTVLSHGATGRGNDQVRFERYANVIDPNFKVYAPWRDPTLLEEFPGRTQMLEYLQQHNIGHQIVSQAKKRYSTDAKICGLSNEAEDLESMETPMTICNPVMGVWPKDAPEKPEEVTFKFQRGTLRGHQWHGDDAPESHPGG
ncbi:unnamed protein product, partial [Prorocentrum cordatum]